eukprot:Rhum_TRINITY_DN25128_c0_g1::Rhum_TRINITY_DN25128_c0_g1_i1::g.181171::m.181171/K17908/WIPI, ATG18; autophagy-related protein 18
MSTRRHVRCLTFNQDSSCLAVGTDDGYTIYTTDPFRRCYEKKIEGGMRIVSMLFRTSLLAIVGAGTTHSPRQLQLFNTLENQSMCDISFEDSVLSVKLSKKRLVVILERCLHVFDLNRMAPVHIIDTDCNPKGIGALSMNDEHGVLAYPKGVTPGSGDVMVVEAMSGKTVHVVRAHKTVLSAIALSSDGTKLATASTKGTVIRVFGISSQGRTEAPLLYALRRGSSAASVYSLSFAPDARLLVCTSNKPTVHIWRADTASHDVMHAEGNGPGTVTDTMRNIVQAERSWAQFTSPAPHTENIVAFSKNANKIYLATREGHMYIHSLNLASGECKREAEYQLANDS